MNKLCCKIIGWDYNILQTCTEASYRTLRRYTSALIILAIVWGFIGFNFANKYADAPIYASIITAAVFIIIIIAVERQIILITGGNKFVKIFRIILAFVMACIGSLIVDQMLLAKDINSRMIEDIGAKVVEILPTRIAELDKKIAVYQSEIDSLELINGQLGDEILARPQISTTVVERVSTNNVDTLGKAIMANEVRKVLTPNPKIKDKERNDTRVDVLRDQITIAQDNKMVEADKLQAEYKANIGLLTELNAVIKIAFSSWVTGVAYVIIFIFFICIELLIVTSQIGKNTKCDYDELIERQQNKRIAEISELLNSR